MRSRELFIKLNKIHSIAHMLLLVGGLGGVWQESLELFRSAFQSSNPIGQYIIHAYTRICAVALTTP